MSFPFPKSLFIEFTRYPLFMGHMRELGVFEDLPSLDIHGPKNLSRKNNLLKYLHARADTLNTLLTSFLDKHPAFYGVVFAMSKMAVEFSVSRVQEEHRFQSRAKVVALKVQFVKDCIIRVKLPGYSMEEMRSFVEENLKHPYLLSFDFKARVLSKLHPTQEETVKDLYYYCESMANRFLPHKEHTIKNIRKVMTAESSLESFFDRVVVINLDRRGDRWEALQKKLAAIKWPFKTPERFSAYDGSKLPTPVGWTSGPGTWGCLLSHREVLARAMQDDLDSILILEDDIFFADNFEERVTAFLKAVPTDWHQVMLGGQYLDNSKAYDINPLVRKVSLCHRTHAIGLRGAFMRYTFSKLCASYGHVDHIMNTFQDRYNVYAPRHFLIGQDGSKSDVSGATPGDDLMRNPPDRTTPVFLLRPGVVLPEEPLPLHLGTLDAFGTNATLADLHNRAGNMNPQVLLSNLHTFLLSNIWYARSVYPSRYFTILNPKGVLLDQLQAAARGINLIFIESLEQLKAEIAKYPFEEELPTQFPPQ